MRQPFARRFFPLCLQRATTTATETAHEFVSEMHGRNAGDIVRELGLSDSSDTECTNLRRRRRRTPPQQQQKIFPITSTARIVDFNTGAQLFLPTLLSETMMLAASSSAALQGRYVKDGRRKYGGGGGVASRSKQHIWF